MAADMQVDVRALRAILAMTVTDESVSKGDMGAVRGVGICLDFAGAGFSSGVVPDTPLPAPSPRSHPASPILFAPIPISPAFVSRRLVLVPALRKMNKNRALLFQMRFHLLVTTNVQASLSSNLAGNKFFEGEADVVQLGASLLRAMPFGPHVSSRRLLNYNNTSLSATLRPMCGMALLSPNLGGSSEIERRPTYIFPWPFLLICETSLGLSSSTPVLMLLSSFLLPPPPPPVWDEACAEAVKQSSSLEP